MIKLGVTPQSSRIGGGLVRTGWIDAFWVRVTFLLELTGNGARGSTHTRS